MSALDRLPSLATTGVGSLPFIDPVEAVRHARRAYDVPFCPQLPHADGDMVSEWLGGGWADAPPCGWTPERDRERPAAWDAFLATIAMEPPAHGLVKLQVTGPVTLAVALERVAGRPGDGAAVAGLAGELVGWLAANVAGQVGLLADVGVEALVVADEPGLAHAGLTPAHADVWDALRGAGAAWGLHVCGAVPWRTVGAAGPDVLSIDATRSPVGGLGAATIGALLERGGRVAWGAVDPVEPRTPADAAARVAAAVGAVTAAGLPAREVFARSMVTPACGTGPLGPAHERLVASVLAVTADVLGATRGAWPAADGAPVADG